ncbi:MAG: hypothetical protein U0X40_11830 [Ferruginibacter sp.]
MTYRFTGEADSTLVKFISYDTLGAVLLRRVYTGKGELMGVDSFEYDASHFQKKLFSSDGRSRYAVTNTINHTNGKVLQEDTFIKDSSTVHSRNYYDSLNRPVLVILWSSFGDTTKLSTTYDDNGNTVMVMVSNKETDTTVTIKKVNSLGNPVSLHSKKAGTESITSYLYDEHDRNTEITVTTLASGKKDVTRKLITYLPNGLAFTLKKFSNGRLTDFQKTYYSYY